MAVDVLGDRVDDDVGAVVEGVLHVGGEEGVVDDDEDAVAVCDRGDGADVNEREGGIGGRFDPDEFGLWADEFGDIDFDGGGEGYFDAVCECDFGEVAVRAAVDVRDGDDMGAGGEGLEDCGGRGGAGGEGEGVAGVFEGGDGFFEVVPVGVCAATVFIEADGLADGGLGEGGG